MNSYFKEVSRSENDGIVVTHKSMHITGLTLRKAFKIQSEHLDHYLSGKSYEAKVRAKVAELTNVDGCDLDAELSVREINERVPRGGSIEFIINDLKGKLS